MGTRMIPAQLVKDVASYTAIPAQRLSALYWLAWGLRDLPGAMVQTGVWNGGSAALMHYALESSGVFRNTYLFDSWQGMSAPTEQDEHKTHVYYDEIHEGEWMVGSKAAVHHIHDAQGLRGYNPIVGWLAQTLPPFIIGCPPLALLHIDVDFYEPTLLSLETFYHRVVPGGLVIIDDYGHWKGCKAAVDEFLAKRGKIDMNLNAIDYTARFWYIDDTSR